MTPSTRGIRTVGFPVSLTTLIGRERDVAEVGALLRNPDNHLVSLIGPGGVGKTRLATAVALEVASDFQDGAIFVPLASIADPGLVASLVAGTLDIRERPDQPLAQTVVHELSTWSALLVLDNFEHVDRAVTLVSQFLESCPYLTILITSRSALRIRGENVYPVAPLAVPNAQSEPSLAELNTIPSIRLFTERARAARSSFNLSAENMLDVARICHRLDGLPLAIELAAAWSRALTPAALLGRLNKRLLELGGGPRDAPSRHQAIRDTIAWSHDLLDPVDQSLFGTLGVFAGGWTIEAAGDVSGLGTEDPLEALMRLVDASLVTPMPDVGPDPRFTMLETIREYALEVLTCEGSILEIEDRHTQHYLSMAEQAKDFIIGSDQAHWLAQLDAEQDNIRRVMERAIKRGDAEIALRLGASIWRFWGQRGQLGEGRSALEQALAIDAPVDISLRSAANYHLANLALDHVEYEAARDHLNVSLTLFRRLEDHDGIASSLNSLGLIDWYTGNYESARMLFNEAAEIWESIDDVLGIAAAQHNLGWLAAKEGNYPQAQLHHREALRLRQLRDNTDAIAYSRWALGAISLAEGNVAEAEAHCNESLALFVKLGDRQGEAYVLHELARASRLTASPAEALRRYHDLLILRQDLGERNGVIESFEEIAAVLVRQGIMEPAARLLGAASEMRAAFSLAPWVAERLEAEESLATLRRALPKASFDAAWNIGHTWTFDRAMNEALTLTRVSLEQPPDAMPFNLTRREQEILRLLAQRRTDPEIAAQLFISTKTASNHVYNILSKLGAKNRREAAEFGKTHALI